MQPYKLTEAIYFTACLVCSLNTLMFFLAAVCACLSPLDISILWNQYSAFIHAFSSSMFFDKPTIALGDMKHSRRRDLCFKSESANEVPQSCPTLCDPMDCSLPGSSIHGIFQVRVLEWVTSFFSRGSSWCREQALYHLSHQRSPLCFKELKLSFLKQLKDNSKSS